MKLSAVYDGEGMGRSRAKGSSLSLFEIMISALFNSHSEIHRLSRFQGRQRRKLKHTTDFVLPANIHVSNITYNIIITIIN